MKLNPSDLNLLRDVGFKRGGFMPKVHQRERCERLRLAGLIEARIPDPPLGARPVNPPVTFTITARGEAEIDAKPVR